MYTVKCLFTAYFSESLETLKAQEVDNCTENDCYSPAAFKSIQSLMYLFPLWSSPLHGNQSRFAGKKGNSYVPPCASNGIVEAHFGVVKGKTLNYKRVRPLEFVLRQLTLNKGKLKETILPVSRYKARKRASAADPEEHWDTSKRKRKKLYHHLKTATRILMKEKSQQNHVRSYKAKCHKGRVELTDAIAKNKVRNEITVKSNANVTASVAIEMGADELSDQAVGRAMEKLCAQFGDTTSGLEHTGMGLCQKMHSLPRFPKSCGKPFVQVLNVGDHWICVSNVFGPSLRDVYIFDSLYGRVHDITVLQVMLHFTSTCVYKNVDFWDVYEKDKSNLCNRQCDY